jgi:hypothetical protein
MAQIIPVFLTTSSDNTQSVELDGIIYTVRIQWNVRNDTGFLDLTENDQDGGMVKGVKIVPNWPLLRQIKGQLNMKGDLIVLKEDAALGTEITYGNFGNGYNFYYVTSEELLEWEEYYGSR